MLILPFAAAVLAALLFFEAKGHRRARLIAKSTLSTLFVVVAAIQPMGEQLFGWLVLAGLILCLVGDVLLGLSGKKAFLAGLVAFLLGHVAYASAFFALGRPGAATGLGAALAVIVSSRVFVWLKPHLGKMLMPVLAYVMVITVMVIAAFTLMGTAEISPLGRGLATAGALLFYVSDLFVARQRFVEPGRVNGLVGLPTYYVGQFLIALSLGQLP
jgi:uncharacterized membrane protein YhhN